MVSQLNHDSPLRKIIHYSCSDLIEDDDEDANQATGTQVFLCSATKLIIAPVADLLDVAEIIIVPDRSLYKVPFAALKDESGKFLSAESFQDPHRSFFDDSEAHSGQSSRLSQSDRCTDSG